MATEIRGKVVMVLLACKSGGLMAIETRSLEWLVWI